MSRPSEEYPKFLMKIGNEEQYASLREAGIIFDCGFVKVEIVGQVREKNGLIRNITEKERLAIIEKAEEHSASK